MDTNLLIIDDEPAHHKLAELLIKQSGLKIKYQSFLRASDALPFILDSNDSSSLPDAILLDLNMPVVSGWGFLDIFETISPCLEKPIDILILTSSLNSQDKAEASKYSCVKGFWVKPFTRTILEEIYFTSHPASFPKKTRGHIRSSNKT